MSSPLTQLSSLAAPLFWLACFFLALPFAFFAPSTASPPSSRPASLPASSPPSSRPASLPAPVEVEAVPLPLPSPLSSKDAEFSGLAWWGERLILLPQYPGFAKRTQPPCLYSIHKSDLLAWIAQKKTQPLPFQTIPFSIEGLPSHRADTLEAALHQRFPGYEGFEAITFVGDQAFLSIEAEDKGKVKGYLLQGQIFPDHRGLRLSLASVPVIPPQTPLSNLSEEALVFHQGRLFSLYEAYGRHVNPSPRVHVFDRDFRPLGTLPIDPLEYRVTDATDADKDGRFWVINYYYPGKQELLPSREPLADTYGRGPTHRRFPQVERLVEFAILPDQIRLTSRPPIQIKLLDAKTARNWEGIVRLDRLGFLLVTDRFPTSILAFLPMPSSASSKPASSKPASSQHVPSQPR